MPYKNKTDRNAHSRQKRKDQGEDIRAYHRKYQREYRTDHLVEMRKYQKEWVRAHRRKIRAENFGKRRRIKTDKEILETTRARRRRYYAKNRDRINAEKKHQRIRDPERFRRLELARYARDKEKRKHQSRIARAKRHGHNCYLSLADWLELLHRYKFRCAYCNALLTKDNRSLDHKVALAKGGTNELGNLVPACRPCNQRKNTKTVEQFVCYLNSNSTF